MKAVPKLSTIVRQIAHRHGVDLDRPGAYLRLTLAGHGQLVIENIGAGRVSVANYIEVGNDQVADPQIVVYTRVSQVSSGPDMGEAAWVPIEFTELFGGWRLYAEVDNQGDLMLYDPTGQVALADYCERTIARNLQRHGWLEHGVRGHLPAYVWTDDEIRARDIRFDELAFLEEDDDVPF